MLHCLVQLLLLPFLSFSLPGHQVSFMTVKSLKLTQLLCGPEKKGSFHCSSGSPCQALANFVYSRFQEFFFGNWEV